MGEIDATIVAAFPDEFAACDELYGFAREHRPSGTPSNDVADELILRTYARGSKSYQGALRLAYVGYGAQAFMLSRSLYEDMLVAHWIKRNPRKAPRQMDRHRRLVFDTLGGKSRRFGLDAERYEKLDADQRRRLRQEFGSGNWTKLSMDGLCSAVKQDFPIAEGHRRILEQTHELIHRAANLVVHNSFASLGATTVEESEKRKLMDLGASMTFVRQALWVAFFSYLHLTSLVLRDDEQTELARLWRDHRDTFTVSRPA
jgi:hypothetical protein